jgi:hypothetical protein
MGNAVRRSIARAMQSKRQHQQSMRYHRRERRRLERFVTFSERLSDLRSVQLFDKAQDHESADNPSRQRDAKPSG